MSIKKQIKSELELKCDGVGRGMIEGIETWDGQIIYMREFNTVVEVDEEIWQSYRYININTGWRYRESWLKDVQ